MIAVMLLFQACSLEDVFPEQVQAGGRFHAVLYQVVQPPPAPTPYLELSAVFRQIVGGYFEVSVSSKLSRLDRIIRSCSLEEAATPRFLTIVWGGRLLRISVSSKL